MVNNRLTKTELRKHSKQYLLNLYRELDPFKSDFYYQILTKSDLVDKLFDLYKVEPFNI